MTSKNNKPHILITAGEPAGIGPDLIIKLSQIEHHYNLTIIGDPDLLNQRAKLLSVPLKITTVSDNAISQNLSNKNFLKVLPVELKTRSTPGTLDVKNVAYVIDMLNIACKHCLENKFDALVTTPIQKSIINDSGMKFSGHTEYLAEICNINLPVMLLACHEFRIALVTTHLPLSDVPKTISRERIKKIINIVIDSMLKRFGIKHPRIVVCGLNPHAGENGYLGTEEKTIITPAINALIEDGYNISGPIPADTAFREEERQKTDVYICMYHDQGLPVLKTLGFGETVNITLGLPIIRTSVDHGTALRLAGTGDAQCNSLLAAIEMAETMALNQLHI
jgi:4-hydroxythreonine-4-phosphate dehydrogenase